MSKRQWGQPQKHNENGDEREGATVTQGSREGGSRDRFIYLSWVNKGVLI